MTPLQEAARIARERYDRVAVANLDNMNRQESFLVRVAQLGCLREWQEAERKLKEAQNG